MINPNGENTSWWHEPANTEAWWAQPAVTGGVPLDDTLEHTKELTPDQLQFDKARNGGLGVGFKLHLNVDTTAPDVQEAVAEALTYINTKHPDIMWKIGEGGGVAAGDTSGKEVTISTGTLDTSLAVAAQIEERIGSLLRVPGSETMIHDLPLTQKVWGRFDVQPLRPDLYHQYGQGGVPFPPSAFDPFAGDQLDPGQLRQAGVVDLTRRYGEYFTGSHGEVNGLIEQWNTKVAPHLPQLQRAAFGPATH